MIDVAPAANPERPPRGVFDQTPASLRAMLASWGEPAYRAAQILDWVYARGVEHYADMTNVSKRLRERLSHDVPLYTSTVAARQVARDRTTKLLLAWPDGTTSECVLIPDGDRRTACISTQVGCPAGCVFCASGLDGLQRSLSAGEIVEQAMRVRRLCGAASRLTNVVFMGLGEPLANYASTVRAVRTINADWGMGIGARKITVSTVGLPSQMRRLADEGLQVTLAVSLHAPTDELRRRIVPWAAHIAMGEVVDAARYYFDRTGREVTVEYVLLGGVNDGVDDARRLAAVCGRMRSNVNVIPYNPVAGLPYHRPGAEAADAFVAALRGGGVNVHLRRSRGADIDGACGQLRRRDLAGTRVARVPCDR
ncbi:MAG: 23S rRNA (adenine(2503)-C(2))-methyltransferase RlmN [Phycisphaerae bacterium]